MKVKLFYEQIFRVRNFYVVEDVYFQHFVVPVKYSKKRKSKGKCFLDILLVDSVEKAHYISDELACLLTNHVLLPF